MDFLRVGGMVMNDRSSEIQLFVADKEWSQINRVTLKLDEYAKAKVEIDVIAGSLESGDETFEGDDGKAEDARLAHPHGLAIAADGSLLVADKDNNRVRKIWATHGKITPDSIITTIAGNGPTTLVATSLEMLERRRLERRRACCAYPLSPRGQQNVVAGHAADHPDVAGAGAPLSPASRQPAALTPLNQPTTIAIGRDGGVFIAETSANRVRKIMPDHSGVVSAESEVITIAGTGRFGSSGDGGPAGLAQLGSPTDIAVGRDGSLFIAEYFTHRIRKVAASNSGLVTPESVITTIASNPDFESPREGGPAKHTPMIEPLGLGITLDGSLLVAQNDRVSKIHAIGAGLITGDAGVSTVIGTGAVADLSLLAATDDANSQRSPNKKQCSPFPNRPIHVTAGPGGGILVDDYTWPSIKFVGPDDPLEIELTNLSARAHIARQDGDKGKLAEIEQQLLAGARGQSSPQAKSNRWRILLALLVIQTQIDELRLSGELPPYEINSCLDPVSNLTHNKPTVPAESP